MACMTALGACDLADGKNALSVYALDEQNGASSGFAIVLYPTGAAVPVVGGLDNFLALPFPANGAPGFNIAVVFFAEPLPLAAPGPFASASASAQAFGASLVAQMQAVNGFTGCMILWAGSLGALPSPPNAEVPMLRFAASLDGFVDSLALTTTPALIASGTDSTGLTLSNVGDSVELSATGSGFLMTGGQLVVTTGSGGALFLTNEITLAVDASNGETMGSLSMVATSQPGFAQTAAGFTYAVQPQPTAGQALPADGGVLYSYPLFDPSIDFSQTSVAGTLVLTPDAATGGTTGRFVFGTGAPALTSTFRTTLLTPVTLTADGNTGGLSLGGAPDGSLRWTPTGTFALGLSGGTDTAPAMLCGLSGVETAGLTATAQITFIPGSPATVWRSAAPVATGTPGYSAWTGDGSPPCTTAWLALTDSVTGAGLAWDAQSAAAPLFVGSATSSVLRPATLASGRFPGVNTPVPMVPYAGIAAAPAGSDLPGFESGFLAVRRAAIIAAASAATPVLQGGASTAVTPQGVVAGFNPATGAMTSLTLAAQQGPDTTVSVGFQAVGGGALPAALADAFLTPQPFVVMTCLSAAVAAAATLSATMRLDGWAFSIPLPTTGQIAGGTFGTVMLFKAAGAPLSQLVTTPGSWSGYATFNDTAFDPTGGLLAAHLSHYVASVRAKWSGGKGAAAYGPLIDILDDPAWSGLLVLKPQVDIAACAASLTPILIATGVPALYADHIGVSATQLSGTGTGTAEQFAQNSALFGFIDYAASSTLPKVGPPPQPAAGSNVAGVLVTTSLQATFVNSAMTAFASAGALTIGSLFGDAAVQPGSSIPLAGSAHSIGDTTTYALAPPAGSITSIPLVSAGISTMVVSGVATTMPTTTSMVFSLSGWLTTPPPPTTTTTAGALDLLSYRTIAYSGYPITMDWSASPVTFNANPAAVQIGALPSAALPAAGLPLAAAYGSNYYRAGSLAASLPVGAQGMLVQPSGSPASLGYQKVTVTPSAGAAPDYTKPWLGLVLDLDLGNSGSLAGSTLLSADFLLAWAPASSSGDGRSLDLWVRFIGPAGMPLGLTIEGVVTIGAASASLSRQAGAYVLRLGEIGLTILSKTFPTAGSVDLYLAGFAGAGGAPTLGWFGGYARAAS